MHNTQTAVVVLAAGSIQNKYKSFSFLYNSPALVPIAARSAVSFTIDYYEKLPVSIYLVINASDEQLVRKELSYYKNIQYICIESSLGVCDTLTQALELVSEDEIIVNVVTTIPTCLPEPNSALFDNGISNNNYYSGIIKKENEYVFKYKKDTANHSNFYAFTGVLRADKVSLKEATKKAASYTDLLEIVKLLKEKIDLKFTHAEWIDTGHEINYADARKKLISSRTFNSITIDDKLGILKKRSKHIEKLTYEANYVSMLPVELQILYPRILNSDLAAGQVMMEYYGYPNLAEYQLYRDIEPLQWKRIFQSLQYSLEKMSEYKFSIGKRAFMDFFYNKTVTRVEEYFNELSDAQIKEANELNINDLPCQNFSTLKSKVKDKIESLYNEDDFSIMHGDFCFNNILYDTFSNTVKLIDPRGSFGNNCIGIYGDRKYDLAKLLHSTCGKYDYIVNNLFQYDRTDANINYSFPLRNNQAVLEELSISLLQNMNVNNRDILFIVGLLFLSMCPLHKDNINRQALMYAHGLYFVNKYVE